MELHNVVRSFNIPAKQELLDAILMRMQRNSQGQIDYKQYIDAINWRDHPGMPQLYLEVLAFVCDLLAILYKPAFHVIAKAGKLKYTATCGVTRAFQVGDLEA